MSTHISFHSNSLQASALEEEPAEEGATTKDSLPVSESMLLDPCPKVLILKIPPRPPRGIPLLKKKEPSTTKVRI